MFITKKPFLTMLALNALILLLSVGYFFMSFRGICLSDNILASLSVLLLFNFYGGLLLLLLTIWFKVLRHYCYSLFLLLLIGFLPWIAGVYFCGVNM